MTFDRRRPGHRAIPPSAASLDQVKILSGVLKALLLATSIGLLIENTDQRSSGLQRN